MPAASLRDLVAVVFDLDGTLVDSETLSAAAMAAALAAEGHEVGPDAHAAIVGGAWPDTRAHLVAAYGLDDDGVDRYRRRARAHWDAHLDRVGVFDDAVATLDALRDVEATVGVCTASSRAYMEQMLAQPALAGRFAASVAREDTARSKPAPEPYLLAAERLGVAARDCVVVEDTPTGVAAATAAGMAVVAVDRGLGLDLSAAALVVGRVTPDALLRVAPRRS